MKNTLTLLLLILCVNLIAQTGKIRGTVIEDATGLPLIGCSVIIEGTTTGGITDFDGNYTISVAPGTYTIISSYVSFATQKVSDVVVKDGGVTVVPLRMKDQSITGETFELTAKQVRNNEAAISTIKRKSVNLIDGISAQTFAKTGDNSAAGALKRVTGVSIQGGKNVYVRGLGDRYTKTILNGITIPGLDPDRNSVQVDIFPTSVVDNIVVYKTFSPDLPGDFTGGMVDIVTKDFPESKFFNISTSFSYNPNMHFKNNFLSYAGYTSDLWADGAGWRTSPINPKSEIPRPLISPENNVSVQKATRAFDRDMSAIEANSLLNQRYNITYGNQFDGEKNTIGFVASLGYSMKYTYYDDFEFNTFQNSDTTSKFNLELVEQNNGTIGKQEVLWNGLLSTSLKREKSKYSLTLFHTQNGIKTATKLLQENTDFSDNNVTLDKTNLYYNQRSISNVLLATKHQFNKKLELKTAISPSLALNKEPDLRQTIYVISDEGEYTLAYGEGALVNRAYRNLEEINLNAKADLKWDFNQWSEMKSTLKTGVNYVFKERSFDVVEYNFRNIGQPEYSGDPDQLFTNEYLFSAANSPTTGEGIYAIGQIDSSNIYVAGQTVIAGYLMNELPIDSSLKVIYGARVEKAEMKYTGQRQTVIDPKEDIYKDRVVLDELDVLPAVSVVYSIMKDVNIRGNFSRTLARPSFKEKSGAQIYDAVTQITFIGNLDLVQTYINNYDLRFEKYMGSTDIISVSGFYKTFSNPIEVVSYNATSADNITPRNVEKATVLGVEFELKKNLEFINEKLKNISVGANVTFAKSEVEMSDIEYQSRVLEARDGQTIEKTRDFQGQAPYLINTFLGYTNRDKAIDATLSYNVQGKSLAIVGIGRIPDVYDKAFHDLTIKLSKGLGGELKRHKVSFNVTNLLNQKRQRVYGSFNANDEIFSSYSEGRFFGVGYSYTFK
ncbi:MAG: carboxypeptidase-like regulatory domain-containing protein [Flavobacteriales bacterium]|nr:carboxypeptidase-like regulatory domain-containing protein [Flavobacteriales bacterium]MCB9364345.1 carboxypeptidase-like regulatory domain-containing protein [Flavobacteriales bacterium]